MEKIRVLVISHMYPKNIDPTDGIFVHKQMTHFMEVDCQAKVISAVPYSPRILWFRPKWKQYGQVPQNDVIEGISVYYPRYIRLPGKWFRSTSCYTIYHGISKIIDSIIKEFNPHILHVYAATPDGYAGLMLKRKYSIPFVCSFMGSDINIYPQYDRHTFYLTKKVICKADQIITVSNALKVTAEAIVKPKREIRVIYMGCDLETFTYDEEGRLQIRKKLGISLEEKVIIFVGHLLKDKGVFELANAFIQLNSKYSDLHLIFVGEGPEHEALSEIVSSNGLGNKVHLVGRKLHSEIPRWLSAADIFVLPTYYEGLPNVILEAMCCGLPVVTTRVGGIPEAIDEETGILVDKEDVSSLVEGIGELIENKGKREKMGKRGREIVEEKFTWKNSAIKLRRIYEKLIG